MNWFTKLFTLPHKRTTSVSSFLVTDDHNQPLVAVKVTVGDQTDYTGMDGTVGFTVNQVSGLGTVTVEAPYGYSPATTTAPYSIGSTQSVIVLTSAATMAKAANKILPAITSRVERQGIGFQLDGQPWRWQFADAYTLPKRVHDGENVDGYLQWVVQQGFNGVAIFLQHWGWMTEVDPNKFSSAAFVLPVDQIKGVVQKIASFGLRCEVRVICDETPDLFNHGHDWIVNRLRDVVEQLATEPSVVSVVLMNEPEFNGGVDLLWKAIDQLGWADKANRPLLMDSGDYNVMRAVADKVAFRHLDILGDHPTRDDHEADEAGKDGHFFIGGWPADENNQGFPGMDVSVVASEPDKWGRDIDGANQQSSQRAEECAAGFAVGCGGATFHSVSGIAAQIPTELAQIQAAKVWVAAMEFYPAGVCNGVYTHMGLADFPYRESDPITGEHAGRRTPDGTVWSAVADATEGWRPEDYCQSGFTVAAKGGSRNQWLKTKVG